MARFGCLWIAFFSTFFCVLWRIGSASQGSLLLLSRSEQFREGLVLRPLPDGKVLAHFQFVNEVENNQGQAGHHHKLFPKSIFQIVHKFRIQEMELSFTQGRWMHNAWGAVDGVDSANPKPGGVELWAQFRQLNEVDVLWRNLTHALSGLFCASINFLEDPAMVSNFGGARKFEGGAVRQGALPREAVCTENLTPWLKLLPCRDRAGLSTLLERPRIHNGCYYSVRVHVIAGNGVDRPLGSLTLTQTLTVVLKSGNAPLRPPNWSLSSLFGKPVLGSCPLATSSHVQIQLESNLVAELKKSNSISSHFDANFNDIFELDSPPDTASKLGSSRSLSLHYDLQSHSVRSPLDVGISWRSFIPWSPHQGPFRATQFLTGRGNGRSAIVSIVNANQHGQQSITAPGVDLTTFQIVPWYVRLYMHTLKVIVDGNPVKNGVRLTLSPADDRKSPSVLQLGLTIPRNTSSVLVSVEFDKGYLRIDEHPPDANRGFDMPAALFTFASAGWKEQIYSDNLLVLLATPDFSMPYNVITFVMTALALYFGSLLNSLRLRSLPEINPSEKRPAALILVKIQKLIARITSRNLTKLKTL